MGNLGYDNNDNTIEMEKERVVLFLEQLRDMVFMGKVHHNDAIMLLGNLADTDKPEPDNTIEEIVFNTIDEIQNRCKEFYVGLVISN